MPSASARHILVETEDEAKDLKQKIEGGEDFGELAKQHSKCPSGRGGGDLGTFKKGDMVPEFDTVVFGELPIGEVSEPVQTQFGYHVILVEEKEAIEPSFAEVEEQLRADLTRQAIEDLLEELRADAEVERFAMDGSAEEEAEQE